VPRALAAAAFALAAAAPAGEQPALCRVWQRPGPERRPPGVFCQAGARPPEHNRGRRPLVGQGFGLGAPCCRGAWTGAALGPARAEGRSLVPRKAALSLPVAVAAALGPTMLGFWKREYGVSYGYGGAVALVAGLVLLLPRGGPPLTALATVHASIHVLYGLRLSIFLLCRELFVARFREMRERIEARAPPKRLARTPFIVSCSFLYLCMSAPVLLTASVPAVASGAARAAAWGGLLVAALGWFVAAWADTHKSLAKAKLGQQTLVTTGVFRYLRHPNYTGELVLWSASTFTGVVTTLSSFSWYGAAGLLASLLGLMGITFVLSRAATSLEQRQRDAYDDDPAYATWVARSWPGPTLRTPEAPAAKAP